ncbi:MAG: chromate transporter [Lachnospiraceae bacterium]|nr:chromate transporter [Lachnospiraceae bacterium]MDD7178475.1 chromate transporter [bacterium]MDY5517401.1 chromate transporter [Lachnospiraceae bacterium]
MNQFFKFLLSMFKIGCIGFGGGSALIPVMEREFIGDGKLDTKENFDKDILIASLTPGALPVELAASLGWRNFGAKGMLLASTVMALPGVAASLLLLTCLTRFRQRIGGVMDVLTTLISFFIIYLIIRYVKKVCRQCQAISRKFYRRAILVMTGVFALSCGKYLYRLLGIDGTPLIVLSTFHILIFSLAAIIAINVIRGLREKLPGRSFTAPALTHASGTIDLLVWLVFLVLLSIPGACLALRYDLFGYLAFLVRGCISVLMSFGGGDAYLAVADGLFVESAIVTSDAFYGDIVAVANILPGSILCKALTAIGYYYGFSVTGSLFGGLAFALGGFGCSVAVSCLVFGIIFHLYERFSGFRSMQTISHYIGPIICGLLGTVSLALLVPVFR